MPQMARPFEMTSRQLTVLARNAGLRYVIPPTMHPRRTFDVRAAMADSKVYASNISWSGAPSMGSWKKWSITKTLSKPLVSAATAVAAMVSNSSSAATPG